MTFEAHYKPGLYAAIDIGTVTCRLLVAAVNENGALNELVREVAICNLGVGVDRTHRLQDEALERTVSVLRDYSHIVEDISGLQRLESEHEDLPRADPPVCVRTIATSASRDAENAADFQQKVAEQTIFNLEVIPGEQEAALSFKGASSAFSGERVVVIDVGGGSTEIVAGLSGEMPEYAHSFDIGCRRVTERFLPSDPPTQDELDAAHAYITQEMKPYLDSLREKGCFDGRVVAVAGTATSAVSMRDSMVEYDPQKVHGSVVTRSDVEELLKRLAALPLEQRKKVIGLEPDRAGVVVAGLLILQAIMDVASFDSFTVSEWDILQGIILDNACI